MQQTFEKYSSQGLAFVTVDANEEVSTIQSTMTSQGLTFPVLLDAGNVVISKYGVRGIPTTFFIDSTGVITDIRVGYITSMSQMEGFLAKILK
jgi:cytochrome c biogenesis protein CcmG/thiol:disulfide interchange protein DsbE